MRRSTALFAAIALLAACDSPAPAEQGYQDYEARIDSTLRARSPRAESLFIEANRARASGRNDEAAVLYDQVRGLVPDFAPAVRRQAMVRLDQGERQGVILDLRELASKDYSTYTLIALAEALARSVPGDEAKATDLREALDLANRAAQWAPEDPQVWFTLFSVAGRQGKADDMRRAATKLTQLAPDAWQSWWSRAIGEQQSGRWAAAEASRERARALGMPAEADSGLSQALGEIRAVRGRPNLLAAGEWTLGAWAAGLGLLMGLGLLLSSITSRAARRQLEGTTGEVSGIDAWMRRVYRSVLWLCCAYYYVSIPLVLIVVAGLSAEIVYAFVSMGHVPIRLVLLVVILAVVTLWSVVSSLFVRGRGGDPGERLDLSGHPSLRRVLDEVAERIGTRPVDTVYLTPWAEMAVMERGGVLQSLRGGGERCLILGVAVLDGMMLDGFQAVLAHEYGHFSNRDTAGGGFALAVRRSLLTMAMRLAREGAAEWFNPAWWFVRGYYSVFMRISQGASRLQEVHADRWAVLTYGSQAFALGLTHVVEASVRFEAHARRSLEEALRERRPIPNVYRYRPVEYDADRAAVSQRIEEAKTQKPTAFDSHPAFQARLEWAERMAVAASGSGRDLGAPVWELFGDRESIERHMTMKIRTGIESTHDVRFVRDPEAAHSPA